MTLDKDMDWACAVQALPGPWGIEVTRERLWIGPMRPDGIKVAEIVCSIDTGEACTADYRDLQDANAKLVAEAPELLALVKEARQYIELGASSALRDGRNSDVGAVLNGLAERMRASISKVQS